MKFRTSTLVAPAGALLCLFSPVAFTQPAAQPILLRYTITDPGDLPECVYTALASINNQGKVVGYAYKGVGHGVDMMGHAFLWENGKMTPLRTLGGKYNHAIGINNRDEIIGDADNNDKQTLPVIWRNGGKDRPIPLSTTNGYAACINDKGVIVGSDEAIFLWTMGNRAPLGFPLWKDHFYRPVAINSQGDIAGYVSGPPDIGFTATPESSFFYQAGKIHDLETLGGARCQCKGMNEAGIMVGWATNIRNKQRACLWKEGKAQELIAPDVQSSEASGINNNGDIVGFYITTKEKWKACLWKDGRAIDLNTCLPPGSGWELFDATGINDAGQIIGTGYHKNKQRSFILTPLAKRKN
jgi:probable HAF family extracellular repeat protein